MNEILLSVGVITFIIYAVFHIVYLIDMRKTSLAVRQFVAKTEENLNPALSELKLTLEEIRKVADDVSVLMDRLRSAVGAIISVEKGIESVYSAYRRSFDQATYANIESLKAGVKAGVVHLFKNLRAKKEGSS